MSSQTNQSRKEITVSRIVFIGLVLLGVLSCLAPPKVNAMPLGWWDRRTYTQTIPVGQGLFHQFQHQGAIYADAYIVSSNGKASLTYLWNQPWLYVSIVNTDTKPVTVTWVEEFYVV